MKGELRHSLVGNLRCSTVLGRVTRDAANIEMRTARDGPLERTGVYEIANRLPVITIR